MLARKSVWARALGRSLSVTIAEKDDLTARATTRFAG